MDSSYSSSVPMETDMMSQFLGAGAHGHHCFAYEQQDESMEAMAAMFLPGLDTDSNSPSSCLNYDMSAQCWPQPQPGNSSSVTSFLDPAHGYGSFEFPVMDPFPHADFDSHCAAIPYLGEYLSHLHGNHSPAGEAETLIDHTPVVTNKRKSRAATTASKKAKKASKKDFSSNDDEGDTYVVDPQSSSSCTSEDGDLDGNAKSSSKKAGTRASRGEATDPQSLYARKRRERINERLKTLQNLVPNGTKHYRKLTRCRRPDYTPTVTVGIETGVVLVQPKAAAMARMVDDGLLHSDMPPPTRTTTCNLQVSPAASPLNFVAAPCATQI